MLIEARHPQGGSFWLPFLQWQWVRPRVARPEALAYFPAHDPAFPPHHQGRPRRLFRALHRQSPPAPADLHAVSLRLRHQRGGGDLKNPPGRCALDPRRQLLLRLAGLEDRAPRRARRRHRHALRHQYRQPVRLHLLHHGADLPPDEGRVARLEGGTLRLPRQRRHGVDRRFRRRRPAAACPARGPALLAGRHRDHLHRDGLCVPDLRHARARAAADAGDPHLPTRPD